MENQLPPLLRKASLALIAGMIGFLSALLVKAPLAYIFTIGLGSLGVGIALVLYLIYFIGELKHGQPESGPGPSEGD